ncbi:hypothetical protein OG194_30660 [Streptomyces sp. NBC_01288]|nr:hypothetical protein OG194_30660 [Streptomyces sp. NBC_01288]
MSPHTASPACHTLTPARTSTTRPAKSPPRRRGKPAGVIQRNLPARKAISPASTLAACTSPGPGLGVGTSSTRSTPGGPQRSYRTARMIDRPWSRLSGYQAQEVNVVDTAARRPLRAAGQA